MYLSGKECQWLSLGKFEEKKLEIGLSSTGEWIYGADVTPGAEVFSTRGSSCVGLLPVLELSPVSVIEALHAQASTLGLPWEELKPFPIPDLLRVAMGMRSDYWIRLALEWAILFDVDIREEELSTELKRVSVDKTYSQTTRQKLARLIAAHGNDDDA